MTVTNTGGLPTSAITDSLAGPDPGQFTIDSDNDTCSGRTLDPGATCAIPVSFTPTSDGDKAANLDVTATSGGTATVALSGTKTPAPAQLTAFPPEWPFGPTDGMPLPPAFIVVANAGGLPTSAITVTLAGADPDQFTIDETDCADQSLPPMSACAVQVSFTPTSDGDKGALLKITAADGGTATVVLSGTKFSM